MTGFDFDIDESGELVINEQEHEINKITDDELRIQLAYTRIKSIDHAGKKLTLDAAPFSSSRKVC